MIYLHKTDWKTSTIMNKNDKILREIPPISDDDFFILLNHHQAKFDYPLHFHPELELNLVLNASGKRIVGDSIAEFDQNDLVLVGPNIPHVWKSNINNNNAHVLTIQFNEDFLSEKSLNRKLARPVKELIKKSKQGILFSQQTIERIKPEILELTKSQDFDSLLRFLTILNDLAISKDWQLLASPAYVDYYRFPKNRRIEKVDNYIKQNIHQQLRVEEVAGLINMSGSAFSHFFKKSTNSSFSDYVTDLRLGNASRLLIETEKSINSICFDSGFNNLSNFNRTFKRKMGFTPSNFRAQQKLITKH